MTGQATIAIIFAWISGALASATFFYALGRRHGIETLAAHFKRVGIIARGSKDDPVAEFARQSGATLRGDIEAKN